MFCFFKKINSSKLLIKICRLFLKIYFTIFFNLKLEKKIIFQQIKVKYSRVNNLINSMIKGNTVNRKIQLRNWIKDELINIYIAKNFLSKDKKILILSEGLIQRIHSFYLFKKKFNKQLIKKYINIIPMSNIIFFVDTNINIIKYRILGEEKNAKNIFYLKNISLLKDRINFIYKCVSKKKKINRLKKITL